MRSDSCDDEWERQEEKWRSNIGHLAHAMDVIENILRTKAYFKDVIKRILNTDIENQVLLFRRKIKKEMRLQNFQPKWMRVCKSQKEIWRTQADFYMI